MGFTKHGKGSLCAGMECTVWQWQAGKISCRILRIRTSVSFARISGVGPSLVAPRQYVSVSVRFWSNMARVWCSGLCVHVAYLEVGSSTKHSNSLHVVYSFRYSRWRSNPMPHKRRVQRQRSPPRLDSCWEGFHNVRGEIPWAIFSDCSLFWRRSEAQKVSTRQRQEVCEQIRGDKIQHQKVEADCLPSLAGYSHTITWCAIKVRWMFNIPATSLLLLYIEGNLELG